MREIEIEIKKDKLGGKNSKYEHGVNAAYVCEVIQTVCVNAVAVEYDHSLPYS
jgi:hypothetical protein